MTRVRLYSVVAALAAFFVVAVTAGGADTFQVRLVSQTNSTITLGWDAQPGYGYLFSAGGVLVSRTNDPSKTSVKFAKVTPASYDVDVIVKGANGHYPGVTPPPPPAACADTIDNDGDGLIDFPNDPGCSSSTDTDETNALPPPPAQCADGADNDGDGLVDLADPGCSSSTDNDETNSAPPPPTGFPDASNTGVPSGTTLTAYTGPTNVTAANTVIDGKTIGCITISAPGVIIKNSKVSCAGGYAVYVDDRTSTATLVTVMDSEIDCKNGPGTAVGEADVTVLRANIHGCENGFDANQNIRVEDSFIHDLYTGGGAHTDGLQMSGHWTGSAYANGAVNLTIRHNTIYGNGPDGSFGTSAIISNSGGDTNIVIDHNLMAGGAFTLYCEQHTKGVNYVVTDNHFSRIFKSTVGYYGPTTECADETNSGNVYHETGLPVSMA